MMTIIAQIILACAFVSLFYSIKLVIVLAIVALFLSITSFFLDPKPEGPKKPFSTDPRDW